MVFTSLSIAIVLILKMACLRVQLGATGRRDVYIEPNLQSLYDSVLLSTHYMCEQSHSSSAASKHCWPQVAKSCQVAPFQSAQCCEPQLATLRVYY